MYLIRDKVKLISVFVIKINLKKNYTKNVTNVVFLRSPKHFNIGKQKIKFTNKKIYFKHKFKNIYLKSKYIYLSNFFFKIIQNFNNNNLLNTKSIKINLIGHIKFIKNC